MSTDFCKLDDSRFQIHIVLLDDARLRIASLIEDGVVRDDLKRPTSSAIAAQALAGEFETPQRDFVADAGGNDVAHT